MAHVPPSTGYCRLHRPRLQVDKVGNTNFFGIADGDRGFKIRGVGSAGGSLFATNCDHYIYTTCHTSQVFVEDCDFVSTVEPARHRKLEPPGGGPPKMISPLGILGFDEADELLLKATMPGVSSLEVVDATGFDLPFVDDVKSLSGPAETQLRVL